MPETVSRRLLDATGCPACGASSWRALPVVSRRAMRSDGALVDAPLAKVSCGECGLARHAAPPSQAAVASQFGEDYALYAHAPGGAFERARQSAYAHWVVEQLGGFVPRRVFEAGCGNGSLLLELAGAWPGAHLAGLDPSSAAIAHARAAGVDASTGYLDADYAGDRHDLVIAINVIEHTHDPRAFLAAAVRLLAPGGRLLIVCPDGDRPSSELLVHDHFFTFSRDALARLARAEGLSLLAQAQAPESLGEFQSVVAHAGEDAIDVARTDADVLHAARHTYLQAWADLDAHLSRRLDAGRPVWCFGVGEATRMLHAYARATSRSIQGYVVDGPNTSQFAGLPLLDYTALDRTQRPQVLLGVRPQVQPHLARRLQEDGMDAIRWDDLVPAA
jgi:SAM-dependent methyltransferase